MEKKTLLKLLEYMERNRESSLKTKVALLSYNPSTDAKRLDYHIEMCESSIIQINRNLINSEYRIDKDILEYMLDQIEMEAYLDKALNISTEE